jgi:uncharacterized protein YbjT (DUF2867 family)
MNLVVGATGLLGGEICRLLAQQGQAVRALVRETSNAEKVAGLKALGAQIVYGDLKDPASLAAACRGASAVISTASSTLSRQEGDSIESVDRHGQLNLIDAAEAAGVEHFVLISFANSEVDFPLQSAKRAVEDRLRVGRMTYTILQPSFFMEVWLSPALGFDLANAAAQVYGAGDRRLCWISFQDVAQFAVAALDNPHARNAVIQLGGPEGLSPLDVVSLAEQALGKPFAVQHVPEEALRAQHASAADPLQQSFAALMLMYAHGDAIDMTATLRALPVPRLKSVREHLQAATQAI